MVNIYSGMKFAVDLLSIDYTDIFAAFSFRNNNNIYTNTIYPDPWVTNSASGILNVNNGFLNYSGTGFFDGQTYFQLNKDFEFNNSTIFISYEKLRHENEILMSSITGSNFSNYSGFCIGINDANKLYLKYWNNVEGCFGFTYSKILSDKNLLVINKTDSIITLGHFNNNTFQFEFEQFEVYQNVFINSKNMYVGGSPSKIEWLNNANNFSGYIDRLYIFNDIPFNYSNSLSRGFYAEATGYEGSFQEFCFTTGFLSGSGILTTGVTGFYPSGFQSGIIGITGYRNIPSGYLYSGVTGYFDQFIGSYIDNCGKSLNIFEKQPLSGLLSGEIFVNVALTGVQNISGSIDIPLTGTITGIQNIYVTGIICDSIFNVTGNVLYIYDDNYLASLSYKEISLLTQINPNDIEPTGNDIIQVYTEPYSNKQLQYNKNLIFDNLNQNYFYLDREFNQNDLLLFGNGQALVNSGYQLIPSGYEIIRSPNLDYFITGITVETNKFFASQDDLFYDYLTGKENIFRLSNYNSGTILSQGNYDNSFIFRNGQKLINGRDYSTTKVDQIQTITGTQQFEILGQPISTNYDGSIVAISSSNFTTGSIRGRVSIYNKIGNNYQLLQRITGSGVGNSEDFGNVISLSNDGKILVVTNNSLSNGRTWIYQSNNLSNWQLFQTLSGNAGSNYFGQRLAFSPDGSVISVGSSTDVISGQTGSMWIFTGSFNKTWVQTQKLTGLSNPIVYLPYTPYWATNPILNSGGKFLCLGLDDVKVGGYEAAGIVYVYTGTNGVYSLSQELVGDSIGQNSGDLFGRSLAIDFSGNTLAVGSLHDNFLENGTLDGSLYIFKKDANDKFYLQQKVLGDELAIDRQNDRFGYFLSMTSDGSTIVTSSQHDGPNASQGAFWITSQESNYWQVTKKVTGKAPFQYFGQNCKISPDGSTIFTSRSPSPLVLPFIDIFSIQTGFLSFNFNITEESEIFLIKDINVNLNKYLIKNASFKIGVPFNHGCSQIYLNGIKQKINNNYIENSTYDLISGTFNPPDEFQTIIYNNTNDFFV